MNIITGGTLQRVARNPSHTIPQQLEKEIDKLLIDTPILPGATAATAESHRKEMLQCKNILVSSGSWSQQQNDAKNRDIAVGMQAVIETALMNGLINDPKSQLSVIVHTNNPPTPLCSEEASKSFFHPGVRDNLAVESTVTSRIKTNNMFLRLGHQVSFCSVYGTKRESPAHQAFFDAKLATHPNLFAFQANHNPPVDLSGATYIYTNGQNEKTIIGIRITQANIPSEKCSLFIGNNSHDARTGQHLVSLSDYIRTVREDNMPEGCSVNSRRDFFELINIQNMIS
jgi:hypothetical protein